MKLKIDAFRTSSGREPVYKFIEEQSGDAARKITEQLDNLKRYGLSFMIENGSVKSMKKYITSLL